MLTIGMTKEQLKKGLELQEKIREVESVLIRLNNPANQQVNGVVSIGSHQIEMCNDVVMMAIEVERMKYEMALKILRQKLEAL